eukprot:366175-Chlamydomonas_euryale.AAC.1
MHLAPSTLCGQPVPASGAWACRVARHTFSPHLQAAVRAFTGPGMCGQPVPASRAWACRVGRDPAVASMGGGRLGAGMPHPRNLQLSSHGHSGRPAVRQRSCACQGGCGGGRGGCGGG